MGKKQLPLRNQRSNFYKNRRDLESRQGPTSGTSIADSGGAANSALTDPEALSRQAREVWWTREIIELIEERGGFGTCIRNLLTDEKFWSPGLYRLLGLQPDSVSPSSELLLSLVHPADQKALEKFLRASERGMHGPAAEVEYRVIRPNGSIRWLSSRLDVLSDRSGAPVRTVVLIMDTTDRRAALEILEISDGRYQGLTQTLPGVSWLTHPDGTAGSMANWRALTGQSPDEIRGLGWLDAIHPDDRPKTMKVWKNAIASGKPVMMRHRIHNSRGDYDSFVTSAVPLHERDGTVREWIGTTISDLVASWREGDREFNSDNRSLTAAQIRGGRGMLNWSVRKLSEVTGLSLAAIRRLEQSVEPVGATDTAGLAIRQALESAGLELLFPGNGEPGVRPRPVK